VTRQQAVHSANIITVAISSDESLLATGSTDRTIAIFSLAAVADESALQPLLVVKVTEAVCLDISWGRFRNRARVMPLPCMTFFFRRAAGTQHLFFASFMSGAPPSRCRLQPHLTPSLNACLLLCHSNILSPHVYCLSFPR
jgi:hypothetical protein